MDPFSFVAAFALSREPEPKPITPTQPVPTATAPLETPTFVPEPAPHEEEPTPTPEPKTTPEANQRPPRIVPDPKPKVSQVIYVAPHYVAQNYQLTDRFGTTWAHTNKTYLETFVAQRNATVITPFVSIGGSCSGGRCSR